MMIGGEKCSVSFRNIRSTWRVVVVSKILFAYRKIKNSAEKQLIGNILKSFSIHTYENILISCSFLPHVAK